jgi:hypothetical protein
VGGIRRVGSWPPDGGSSQQPRRYTSASIRLPSRPLASRRFADLDEFKRRWTTRRDSPKAFPPTAARQLLPGPGRTAAASAVRTRRSAGRRDPEVRRCHARQPRRRNPRTNPSAAAKNSQRTSTHWLDREALALVDQPPTALNDPVSATLTRAHRLLRSAGPSPVGDARKVLPTPGFGLTLRHLVRCCARAQCRSARQPGG